ncbi:TraR/DksA C4-type zinc finger protein [Aeromicrobium sp. Leaf245]|uniref:TraR/DksA family transcriptional regulator n=1 Tax=Aeromicrobium sp. Leaf245 TaxID=1736306 RepID=UPI0006FA192B|nr:TraR/DksA C4-type zinc finger protein [Aeromicrobium sp. Leaf245]KQO41968.1 hypothetical protein ASF05_12850 [Aeromicrobium sp. Leaf245]
MSETTWTPDDLDELRARMLLEQDDLAARLRERRRTGPECGDSVDHANVNVATELDVLAEARDRELLTQVERILQRLEGGTYATCESCGGPVERARQEAYPHATSCLTCARSGRRG